MVNVTFFNDSRRSKSLGGVPGYETLFAFLLGQSDICALGHARLLSLYFYRLVKRQVLDVLILYRRGRPGFPLPISVRCWCERAGIEQLVLQSYIFEVFRC